MSRLRLGPHFVIEEFDCHDGRRVPESREDDYRRLVRRVLEPLRDRFGVCHVVSGFRPPDYNARVGGAKQSVHMGGQGGGIDGVAADVRFARGSVFDWQQAAESLLTRQFPPGGGLGYYPGAQGWIHVDTRGYRARWSGPG